VKCRGWFCWQYARITSHTYIDIFAMYLLAEG
jgi:hypothetical protein